MRSETEEIGVEEGQQWLALLREFHTTSGLSFREVAAQCDIDHSYVALILSGKRRPSRDVLLLLLVFGYGLDRIETDRMLILAGFPPFGRSARTEYRRERQEPVSLNPA